MGGIMRVQDAVRGYTRLMGIYLIIAAIVQIGVGVLVIWAGYSLKLESLETMGFYALVLNMGFMVIGPLVIVLSGPLSRFAAKYARDEG
jgi:hypothetical protein